FKFIDERSAILFSYNSKDFELVNFELKNKSSKLFNLEKLNYSNGNKINIDVSSKQPILYWGDNIVVTGRVMLENEVDKTLKKPLTNGLLYKLKTGNHKLINLFNKVWDERYWHLENYYPYHTIGASGEILYGLALKD